MGDAHYKVEVQGDHLEKLASARPIQALSELVWNALDADATEVLIEVESTDMGMQSVAVRDNGHGIPHEDVAKLFGQLGGSWKAHGNRSKNKSRMLHGKEGKGRFKALALGRVADWKVVQGVDEQRTSYTITLIRDNLIDVRVTEPVASKAVKVGVDVRGQGTPPRFPLIGG